RPRLPTGRLPTTSDFLEHCNRSLELSCAANPRCNADRLSCDAWLPVVFSARDQPRVQSFKLYSMRLVCPLPHPLSCAISSANPCSLLSTPFIAWQAQPTS